MQVVLASPKRTLNLLNLNQQITWHEKPYFFPNIQKRCSFQKNRTGIRFFLYYQKRLYFTKIWSYSPDGKWKRIFLKKIHGNMVFPSNVLKRRPFQKFALECDLSCIIREDGIFSPENLFFSLDGKWKMIFLKKYMDIWYFPYISINVTNMILPFCQKNRRWSSPEKIHLKVIDILDWHSRKSSSDLQRWGVFIYCFPVKKKKTGTLIYRIKIWLLLQFIWLKIFYNEESSIVCNIEPSGVVL